MELLDIIEDHSNKTYADKVIRTLSMEIFNLQKEVEYLKELLLKSIIIQSTERKNYSPRCVSRIRFPYSRRCLDGQVGRF